jgi:hypothetical protein
MCVHLVPGCILAELYTGYPLFPGENEVEQLACIMEVLGLPPKTVVAAASRRRLFFGKTFLIKISRIAGSNQQALLFFQLRLKTFDKIRKKYTCVKNNIIKKQGKNAYFILTIAKNRKKEGKKEH